MTRRIAPALKTGRRLIIAVLSTALLLASDVSGQIVDELESLDSNIRIDGVETSYDAATGVVIAKGTADEPVFISYGDVTLYAGSAEYHRSSGDVYARGDVAIFRGELTYKGDSVVYNINTGEITADEVRSGIGPLLYDTDDMTLNAEETDVIELDNTLLTTHDFETPNYHFKAKRIEIYPDEKVVFHNLKVYAGKIPVMWLPYLSQPLNEELGYSFAPGYTSRWGAFLLNEYGILLGDHSLLTLELDYRSERGFAGGFELESMRHRSNPNFGTFEVYYANDDDPLRNASNQDRRGIDSDRYRVGLQHRIYLPGPEDNTFYIDFDINKFSDQFFLEDFFPSEFVVDPRPDNFVNIVKTGSRGELSLWTRFRVNDFFSTDSRLPELALDVTTQPIFDTGLFYVGQTSAGFYKARLSDQLKDGLNAEAALLEARLPTSTTPIATRSLLDDLRARASDDEFFRFDTHHEVLYPLVVTDGVSLVPRFGVRGTAYSGVEGGTRDFGDETRLLMNVGLEGSLKFSKIYPDASMPAFGIDELRHIVQPYFNYSLVAGDDLPDGFPLIDRYTPTTQLRPLNLPLVQEVDSIREWNVLRLGTRNRLQTKREGGSQLIGGDYYNQRLSGRASDTHNWLELDTFFDIYFEDGEFDRDYSNLHNRLTWWPLPWLVGTVDAQLPVFGDPFEFTEVNTSFYFMPWRNTELTVGHRYLDDHPFFRDSNLLTVGTYTRLSENWGFSIQQRFELEDNVWELQQYSIHRDLTSWTLAIGGVILDNRVDEEYGIVLTLSLKDFPRARLPLSVLPGSGESNRGLLY